MADLDRVSSDLEFVRAAVKRGAVEAGSPGTYFLWAAITLVGFALNDWRPQASGAYWMVAGPGGAVISYVLGGRWARRVGQASSEIGTLHAIHWAGFMAMILLLVPLVLTGQLTHAGLPRVILLLVALAYLTAGNYLDRRLRWLAFVVVGCYGLTFALDRWAWTVSGVVLALCLAATGLAGMRRGATA
jgi:hypothetical protein